MLWGLDEVALFVLTVILFLVVIEVGWRLGSRHRRAADEATKSHITALQSALLGLLALLLGFTFAMAVSRFDTRKSLVLEESNAIGKAYWRSQLIPEAHRARLAQQLKQYVAARLDFHLAGNDKARLDAANATSLRLEQEIWKSAGNAQADEQRSTTTLLFIQAINDMFDVNEKRRVAQENHVPDPVLYLLLGVSVGALGFIAYGVGLSGRRRFVSTGIFAALIALVLTFIVDIDRPYSGLIVVSQESMMRTKAILDQGSP